MKLLLTSAGVKNASIRNALVDLLGRPIAECSALCIPTAAYGHPMVGSGPRAMALHQRTLRDPHDRAGVEVGWRCWSSPPCPASTRRVGSPWYGTTDVLLVAGGDALYLCHWMRESRLADLLPSLTETVWVGLSAGSMVLTPRIGQDFVQWEPPTGGDDDAGAGRLLDLPARERRRQAGQHHGRGRAVGGRHLPVRRT